MEFERSLAAATATPEPQEGVEGRTRLATAVEAVLSDVKITERPRELSIKAESAKTEQAEEQPRTTAQGALSRLIQAAAAM